MVNINNLTKKIKDWTIFSYDCIDSTSDEIKKIYNIKSKNKLIVVSNEQTKGHGTYKKTWISPKNSGLYASWLINNYTGEIKLLPLLAGLSCLRSLQDLTQNIIFLKWPNDLILCNKKLGGILVEKYKEEIIIGVGINLFKNHLLPQTSVALEEANDSLENDFETLRDKILFDITSELENNLNIVIKNGRQAILDAVLEHLYTPPGGDISFPRDNEIVNAKVVGLNNVGELIVQLKDREIITLSK